MRTRHPRRGGFTLVELLVAAALTILIMSILAGAFTAALDSLSLLRSIGGMAERNRSAHTQLSEDLKAAHFEGGDATSSLRLSDIRYDQLLPGSTTIAPPPGGFFFIRQGNGSVYEGLDQDGVYSTRGDGTAGHVLGMTVRRTGKTQDQLFTVDLTPLINYANNAGNPPAERQRAGNAVLSLNSQSVSDAPAVSSNTANMANPANLAVQIPVRTVFIGQWAEVFWFLDNPQTLGGTQNYSLHRRVRVLTTTPVDFPIGTGLEEVLSSHLITAPPPARWQSNTTDTIRVPANRLYAAPATTPSRIPATSTRFGDDIVLTNVISFEVKATWTAGPQWTKPVGALTYTYAPNVGPRPFPGAVAIPAGTTNIPFPTPAVAPPVPNWFLASNGDSPFDDLPVRNAMQADPYRPENIGDETANTPGPYNGPPTNLGTRVFDTWAPLAGWNTPGNVNCIPFRARITGLKIKIRSFDVKTQQTRQSTLIVDL